MLRRKSLWMLVLLVFFLIWPFFWVFLVFKSMLDIKFSIIQFGMIESVHDFPVTDYSYSWFGSWGIDSWWFHQIKYEFWYTAFLPVCFLGALVVFIHDEYKVFFFPLGIEFGMIGLSSYFQKLLVKYCWFLDDFMIYPFFSTFRFWCYWLFLVWLLWFS